MSRTLALGIDVGTSTTKAAVFDLDDPVEPLTIAGAPSAVEHPRPGWSEADPFKVLDTVLDCVRAAISQLDTVGRSSSDVLSIGISGTACGSWLIDVDGALVRPAILWNDSRAAHIVDEWRRAGITDELFGLSGNVPFPGYTLPVLAWLRREEPQSLRHAGATLCCKDWLRFNLTGVVATDESDASYFPFNITRRSWDEQIMRLCGVEDLYGLLPPIASASDTQPLLPAIANEWGLRSDVSVAVGATDIVAGLVGGGALSDGDALTILGTSANSSVVTNEPEFSPRNLGIMAAGPGRCWARTMINTSGSTTLDWSAALLGLDSPTELETLALDASGKTDRPVLVPYLAGAGTVSPRYDPLARGSLVGIRSQHTRADIARAAIEGLAFSVADSYKTMTRPVAELTAIGGAARSNILLQSIANALDVTVHRPVASEFGARGVALLAGAASGHYTAAEFVDAAKRVQRDMTFSPDADAPATTAQYAIFQHARDHVDGIGALW